MPDVLVTVLVLAFLAAFIVDLVGNLIEFDHKFSNALASSLVFLAVVVGLTYWLQGDYKHALIATGLLFVADLVCNYLMPRSRLLNALVTGALFAALLLGYLMLLA